MAAPPARRALIVGNWKMHKTVHEALAFLDTLVALLEGAERVEVVIAAPFTALGAMKGHGRGGGRIALAAQNLFWEEKGAYTGEIAPGMIADVGCAYVLVGHSERRRLFGETDATVRTKATAVLAAGLTPIVCIGESLAERDAGGTFAVLARQVGAGIADLVLPTPGRLAVAYEPVWAIGTGRPATAALAQEAHAHVRDLLTKTFGADTAAAIRILYGGSVTPENIDSLMAEPDIDGALVGGASLVPESFGRIVTYRS